MKNNAEKLISELRRAGFSRAAIRAAWPSWWNEEAAKSPSGRSELRFTLARRLGLSPKPLLGERVEFIWNDEARFKHLTTEDTGEKAALTSFGMSIGRLLLRANPAGPLTATITAKTLRDAILTKNQFVDLDSLLGACWALGIPVIHLRVFALESKKIDAMVIGMEGRYAILLGRDSLYPAPVAFTLAHEIGHIMLGHLGDAPALVDLEDSVTYIDGDDQEKAANQFALTLLTGVAEPDITTNVDSFGAQALANAVLKAALEYRIEPGTLALCLAHRMNLWPRAMKSMKFIYNERKPTWQEVNGIASLYLDPGLLGDEAANYLQAVMKDVKD
jgi:hypothetical protein